MDESKSDRVIYLKVAMYLVTWHYLYLPSFIDNPTMARNDSQIDLSNFENELLELYACYLYTKMLLKYTK